MSKIYYLMGKSATGKDTVYKELMKRRPELKTAVTYTTRPIREGETEGTEYFFTDAKMLRRFLEEGKVIELRTYETVHGPWSYFTADDGQFDLKGGNDYLTIGTLESYEKMCRYFGAEAIVPLYLELPDGMRLRRALEREENQKEPCYRELCRRYLADEKDFSEERLNELGIKKRFSNICLEGCIGQILQEMQENRTDPE